jgi:hypothetical protein
MIEWKDASKQLPNRPCDVLVWSKWDYEMDFDKAHYYGKYEDGQPQWSTNALVTHWSYVQPPKDTMMEWKEIDEIPQPNRLILVKLNCEGCEMGYGHKVVDCAMKSMRILNSNYGMPKYAKKWAYIDTPEEIC